LIADVRAVVCPRKIELRFANAAGARRAE